METFNEQQLTMEELKKEIRSIDELYTEYAEFKRHSANNKEKHRNTWRQLKLARSKLIDSELALTELQTSGVRIEDYKALTAKYNELQAEHNSFINSSTIQYQKTCQEYGDKCAALEHEISNLKKLSAPDLNKKVCQKKYVSDKQQLTEQVICEPAVGELESKLEKLKLQLKYSLDKTEHYKSQNEDFENKIKSLHEQLETDRRNDEEIKLQRENYKNKVKILQKQLKTDKIHYEEMIASKDELIKRLQKTFDAEVITDDCSEKTQSVTEKPLEMPILDETSDVDEVLFQEALAANRFVPMLSPIASPPYQNDEATADMPFISLQNEMVEEIPDIDYKNDKELLEILPPVVTQQNGIYNKPTKEIQPTEYIRILRRKISMHTQTENEPFKTYANAKTQTDFEDSLTKDNLRKNEKAGSRPVGRIKSGKISKVKEARQNYRSDLAEGIEIYMDDYLSSSSNEEESRSKYKAKERLTKNHLEIIYHGIPIILNTRPRKYEKEKIVEESNEGQKEIGINPVRTINENHDIVEPKSVDSGYIKTDTDGENETVNIRKKLGELMKDRHIQMTEFNKGGTEKAMVTKKKDIKQKISRNYAIGDSDSELSSISSVVGCSDVTNERNSKIIKSDNLRNHRIFKNIKSEAEFTSSTPRNVSSRKISTDRNENPVRSKITSKENVKPLSKSYLSSRFDHKLSINQNHDLIKESKNKLQSDVQNQVINKESDSCININHLVTDLQLTEDEDEFFDDGVLESKQVVNESESIGEDENQQTRELEISSEIQDESNISSYNVEINRKTDSFDELSAVESASKTVSKSEDSEDENGYVMCHQENKNHMQNLAELSMDEVCEVLGIKRVKQTENQTCNEESLLGFIDSSTALSISKNGKNISPLVNHSFDEMSETYDTKQIKTNNVVTETKNVFTYATRRSLHYESKLYGTPCILCHPLKSNSPLKQNVTNNSVETKQKGKSANKDLYFIPTTRKQRIAHESKHENSLKSAANDTQSIKRSTKSNNKTLSSETNNNCPKSLEKARNLSVIENCKPVMPLKHSQRISGEQPHNISLPRTQRKSSVSRETITIDSSNRNKNEVVKTTDHKIHSKSIGDAKTSDSHAVADRTFKRFSWPIRCMCCDQSKQSGLAQKQVKSSSFGSAEEINIKQKHDNQKENTKMPLSKDCINYDESANADKYRKRSVSSETKNVKKAESSMTERSKNHAENKKESVDRNETQTTVLRRSRRISGSQLVDFQQEQVKINKRKSAEELNVTNTKLKVIEDTEDPTKNKNEVLNVAIDRKLKSIENINKCDVSTVSDLNLCSPTESIIHEQPTDGFIHRSKNERVSEAKETEKAENKKDESNSSSLLKGENSSYFTSKQQSISRQQKQIKPAKRKLLESLDTIKNFKVKKRKNSSNCLSSVSLAKPSFSNNQSYNNHLTQKQILVRLKAAEKLMASVKNKTTERSSFKRPLCRKKAEVLQYPLSPEPVKEITLPCEPKIIPLERILEKPTKLSVEFASKRLEEVSKETLNVLEAPEMSIARGRVLLQQMLQFHDDEHVKTILKDFVGQKPEFIVNLVLRQSVLDKRTKPAKRKGRIEPFLTATQQVLLKLMLGLERMGVKGVREAFLKEVEYTLPILTDLNSLPSLTKLYVAVCQQNMDIWRLRRTLCSSFLLMEDRAIPFMYHMILAWTDVMPKKDTSAFNNLITKAIVSLVFLKKCNQPGYNLNNLRRLLCKAFKYDSDADLPKKMLSELFDYCIEERNECAEALALALCAHVNKTWLTLHIDKKIKPKINETNNFNKVFCGIRLVMLVTKYLLKENDQSYVENTEKWLQQFCDGSFPDYVRDGAATFLIEFKKCK